MKLAFWKRPPAPVGPFPYSGRLTFDPETDFHTDLEGRKVVTEDGGLSWRYAEDGDPSHNARYQRNVLSVDTTPTVLARLTVEHGPVIAEKKMRDEQPHHYEVQTDDQHYDLVARDLTRPKFDPDVEAETITGHTDAYA